MYPGSRVGHALRRAWKIAFFLGALAPALADAVERAACSAAGGVLAAVRLRAPVAVAAVFVFVFVSVFGFVFAFVFRFAPAPTGTARPRRSKNDASSRCIFRRAMPIAVSRRWAVAVVLMGRARAGRASTTHRLSGVPDRPALRSLRWTSTRVSRSVKRLRMRLASSVTKLASRASDVTVRSLLS